MAVGGAVGAISRYELGLYLSAKWSGVFPLATLLINLLGAAILGFIMAAALERGVFSAGVRLALGTGFCGGFTTFSAWMTDSYKLFSGHHLWTGLLNILVAAAGGLLCALLGAALARQTLRAR